MRRLAVLLIVLGATLHTGVALAGQNNTGCGLGTMLFKDNDGLVSQVCAATTNESFGNQTFGITSGTLGCAKPATFTSNEKLNTFVAENMDNLARDIARGDGEYLTTLAVLLDVPVQDRPALYTRLQTNFSTIYPSAEVTHLDVLKNLETLLSSI